MKHQESFYRAMIRELLSIFCEPKHRRICHKVTISGPGISAVVFQGEDSMAVVIKTGGPLKMDVHNFVDDKGNPVTSSDAAVYSSSNESVATVANDPDDAQDGIITLTGQLTAEGETVVIKATFSPLHGSPFDVTGNLIVIEPAAASAQAVITGPGVVDGA